MVEVNQAANCVLGDESFLDQYILNRCDAQGKSSSPIIAYTLFDIWDEFGLGEIGDYFLFYRLHILEKEGKIKITDRDEDFERGKRLFNVTCV